MVVRRSDLTAAKQRKPGPPDARLHVVFGGITWMKLDQEPFKDVRVRRALAMASNWQEVLETNAWSQGHGAPNPAIPAALREWSIPIDQLTARGPQALRARPGRGQAAARRGRPSRTGFKTACRDDGRLRARLHGRRAGRR